MSIDQKAAQNAIRAFLEALGQDPSKPELAETPERVTEAFERDLLTGEAMDVAALLADGVAPITGGEPAGVVAVREIAVATVCPHHLMPALGRADVAYRPGPRVIGLGTLTRVVDAYARRLTLQETIGQRVARALVEHAGAVGAVCRISLRHSCLAARGARQADAFVVTVSRAGEELSDLDQALLSGGRG